MNIKSIRNKVKKAIEQADYTVTILRDKYIGDGMGSTVLYEEAVPQFELQCVVDNSSSQGKTVVTNPNYADAPIDNGTMLVCLYDETKLLERGDYFLVNGNRYIIEHVDDVMHLHIFLQCKVKVISNG